MWDLQGKLREFEERRRMVIRVNKDDMGLWDAFLAFSSGEKVRILRISRQCMNLIISILMGKYGQSFEECALLYVFPQLNLL